MPDETYFATRDRLGREVALPTAATVVAAIARNTVAATAAALAGTTNATGIVGPFAPDLARPIWLTLSGNWTGTVQLLRSTDAGVTKLPITVGGAAWASFAANCNEAVAEESVAGATYFLSITLTAGSVNYRVAQ